MLFTLYTHQQYGVEYLLSREKLGASKISGSILADQMGLGKTIQTIALIEASSHTLTILFCPTSLVTMWESQINTFSDSINTHIYKDDVLMHDFLKLTTSPSHTHKKVIICSYGLSHRRTSLKNIQFDRIVCDEAHYFRNPKSKTFNSINRLQSTSRLAITATPLQNSIKDIATIINFVLGQNITLNLDFIRLFIKHRMLSRKIDDIGISLPTLKINNIQITPKGDNKRVLTLTNEFDYTNHLEKIIRTKQSCVFPQMLNTSKLADILPINSNANQKTQAILDSIKTKQENCIVFTEFISEQHYLFESLKNDFKVACVRGSTPIEERTTICADTSIQILLIQIQTGCVGLNLQHFNQIYFSNIQWNPTVTQQAIGRINRIGQRHNMDVYIYSMKHTIEDRIVHVANKKLELIESILGV